MSSEKLNKRKQAIQQAELDRKRLMGVLLAEEDLIEGSLSDILVKCGRAGCHCEKGPAHPITRLNTREKGKVRNKVVRIDDVKHVRQRVQTYKDFKLALKELATIESHEKEIFAAVKKYRNKNYE